MKEFLMLIVHILRALIKISQPSDIQALVTENTLLRHQLQVYARRQKRSPKLTVGDRLLFGFGATFIKSFRLAKIAILLKPATILKFHKALVKKKYRQLFSSSPHRTPGSKDPSDELINAIVVMKQRNYRFGNANIARNITALLHMIMMSLHG